MGNNTPKYRLVFRRSRPLTKTVVLTAVVLSMAALLALRGAILTTQMETDALRAQAAQLEQEQARLEDKVNALGSVDGVVQVAEEELGLADPDTVIIEPVS